MRSVVVRQDGMIGTGAAASLSGVSVRTVSKWADEGLLKSFRLPQGHRRFLLRDLAAFLHEHGVPLPDELKHYVEEEK